MNQKQKTQTELLGDMVENSAKAGAQAALTLIHTLPLELREHVLSGRLTQTTIETIIETIGKEARQAITGASVLHEVKQKEEEAQNEVRDTARDTVEDNLLFRSEETFTPIPPRAGAGNKDIDRGPSGHLESGAGRGTASGTQETEV